MNREDIVTRYNIDLSKVSVTLPLEKNGRYYKAVLSKSDVEYLYSELNLSIPEIIELTGITQSLFYRLLNKYGLKQTKERRFKNARNRYKETCLKHFGTDNPNELKEIRDKIKQTKLERYGNENYSNREKAKQTSLKRYGAENWLGSDVGNARKKQWCQQTYGVDNVSQVEEIQQKKKETCQRKYGSDFYMQTEQFKERNKKCWDSKPKDEIEQISKLRKQTLLEKTGYGSACENPETIEKRKETNFKKYGVSNWAKTETHKEKYKDNNFVTGRNQKIYTTKKKNNTFNTSKDEDKASQIISQKFPDTIRQYKDSRYPFACDFYIPSLDLFIEYQGCWTHGFHPFDSNNADDLNKLEKWKQKAKEASSKQNKKNFYEQAIYTWVDLDVRKRQTAKANRLNWFEFFDFQSLEKFLTSFDVSYKIKI